ncbi:Transposable element P transposase [Frankliniella fusca]|uniref:Transposable element P transposase n=1 Tax=Frankliniella fusca TaxID=407009 RepID=A0AAE1HHH7_9NEOP|nr:Transposable element P transposase [Frankliniella fusca]
MPKKSASSRRKRLTQRKAERYRKPKPAKQIDDAARDLGPVSECTEDRNDKENENSETIATSVQVYMEHDYYSSSTETSEMGSSQLSGRTPEDTALNLADNSRTTLTQVAREQGYCSSSSEVSELESSRSLEMVAKVKSLNGNDSSRTSLTQKNMECSKSIAPPSGMKLLTDPVKKSVSPATSAVDVSSNFNLLLQVKEKLELFLFKRWLVIIDKDCLHVVYYSIQDSLVVQRSLVVSLSGDVKAFVHNEPICMSIFKDLDPAIPLEADSINNFVDRIVSVVNYFKKLQVCGGIDDKKFQPAWSSCPLGYTDKNSFKECRFVETFRSHLCLKVVQERTWRCSECKKMYGPLRRRISALEEAERHPNTSNKYLSERHMLEKMEKLQKNLRNEKKKNSTLQERMAEMIRKESVPVDNQMADVLTEILSNSNMTPAQSIFMQQQVKASQLRNASGMRWHPTMIRFALSVHLTSPAAYEMMRQTGMIKLPSSSTLFEYTHVEKVSEGIDETVIKSVADRLKAFKEKHKKYHVLMADEIHISQNLVFQKSTGQMIGYTSLDDIESEVANLEKCLDDPNHEREEVLASKMLVYMIKGVSNGIKESIACFTVGKHLSANQLYVWSWKVIGALERSGIAVVAYVSDGASVNRAFIKKHTPATVHRSGIIFDTINKCAKDRILYFIADVPHLLKTIRNCILNSRCDGKKSRRKMMKNGKKISWDFIIKLYEMKKGKNLRKSYKLNPMNVYPDSYGRMKVKLAAQALSGTVCKDIRSQNWDDARETEVFIEKVNEWFDCLNGAHSSQGKKTNNSNLNPYTSVDDCRFDTIANFLMYLEEWEEDAKNPNQTLNATAGNNTLNAGDCNESEIEDGVFNPEEDTPASRRLLSSQTLEGIRLTSFAFKPLVSFLLSEGVSFINARIFCQDPLEQHFSKIRAGGGGNNNPNAAKLLNRNRVLHTIGQMGMRKRKGNSGEACSHVEVTTEPLAKRRWTRTPKLLQPLE